MALIHRNAGAIMTDPDATAVPDKPGSRVFEPSVDRKLVRAAVPPPSSRRAAVLRPITSAGDGLKPWLLATVVLLIAERSPRRRRTAALAWAATGVASVLSAALKRVVDRRRPTPERLGRPIEGGKEPSGSSWPSSHTASAVAFTVAVAISEPMAGALLAPVTIAVAGTRIASGHHYATDVAAGAVVGGTAALAVTKAWTRLGLLAPFGDRLRAVSAGVGDGHWITS
jgi:membrane-associated phospholipid phosphatase